MNNPELYAKTNKYQQTDAREFLAGHIPLVQWKPDGSDRAMDIGCGTGDVTTQILLPKLPESLRELVGTDISAQMLQYARTHHPHSRVTYNVLDISTKNLPQVYYERFNQVFSLYALHWVQDQRQAMKNIFDMLQPGGHVLLLYPATHPSFEVILKLADLEHWKLYMTEPNVSVYQRIQNVEESLHSLLQQVGFNHIKCSCKQKTYIYENINAYTDAIISVNPVIPHLPEHVKEKYQQEWRSETKTQVLAEGYAKNDTSIVRIPYRLIEIHAVKK